LLDALDDQEGHAAEDDGGAEGELGAGLHGDAPPGVPRNNSNVVQAAVHASAAWIARRQASRASRRQSASRRGWKRVIAPSSAAGGSWPPRPIAASRAAP